MAKRQRRDETNVIEIAVTGGLGNQMFQYAAARALAMKTDADLWLDLGFYRSGRHRAFELSAFPEVEAHSETREHGLMRRLSRKLGLAGSRFPVYREPHFHTDPDFFHLKPPVRLEGYFQSVDYFSEFGPQIRRELTPEPAADRTSLALADTAGDACALHVRRGDYVTNARARATYAECSADYYRAAIDMLPDNTTVMVFSDDLEWARKNLPAIRKLVFVGNGAPRPGLADLWLMSLARHHIIANSSFSWWGAWLAGPGRGLTIAPVRWFNDPAIIDDGLIADGWLRLPN